MFFSGKDELISGNLTWEIYGYKASMYKKTGGNKFATSSLTKDLKMHHAKEHSEFTKAKGKKYELDSN